MNHQQNAAAGDEAVGYVEHRKFHEGRLNHIHHIAQAHPVDHIAETPAVDGGDAPALEGRKAHGLFEILIEHQPGKRQKNQGKQPLLPLKGGKSCPGVLDVGNLQQPGNQGLRSNGGNIQNGQIFGKLVKNKSRKQWKNSKSKFSRITRI